MIFVVLGTQDKKFNRLVDKIQQLMLNGKIGQDVIIQAGSSDAVINESLKDRLKIYSFIDREDFNKYISQCDFMITHGGVGTIMSGLRNNKKIIAVARLAKYHEHENDHQLQIISTFDQQGLIIGCPQVEQLDEKLNLINNFVPKQYVSNKETLIEDIAEKLEL